MIIKAGHYWFHYQKEKLENFSFAWFYNTRQSAQWGMYTPDQGYRHFLKSTK